MYSAVCILRQCPLGTALLGSLSKSLWLPISFKNPNHTILKSNLAHFFSCLLCFQLDVRWDRFKSFHSEIVSGLVSQGISGPYFSHATYSVLGKKLMPTGLWWPWGFLTDPFNSPSLFHTLGPGSLEHGFSCESGQQNVWILRLSFILDRFTWFCTSLLYDLTHSPSFPYLFIKWR